MSALLNGLKSPGARWPNLFVIAYTLSGWGLEYIC